MKKIFLWIIVILPCFTENIFETTIKQIAFGSCSHQDKPQKIWNAVVTKKPDLFIFLGDNVYGDTYDMVELKTKYQKFGNNVGLQKLKKVCPIIATWDDHDYGRNDVGLEHPLKDESKKIFLDFFGEPEGSQRRKRQGIYTSYYYGKEESKRIQIILLDVRYFRTHLERISDVEEQVKRNDICMGAYTPVSYDGATMLGKEQWQWLEEELRKTAQVRIICSSTQFVANFNGWEAWANMPLEYQKMLDVIYKTRANGVIFISGDTHWAELSMAYPDKLYPIYDLTSSGLTEVWDGYGPNNNRIKHYLGKNFGTVNIDWNKKDTEIHFGIHDINGNTKIKKTILLSELQVKD